MSDRRIKITYEIVKPQKDDEYLEYESGFEDDVGVDMEPDEYDAEEGITAVDKAVKLLKEEGVTMTSGSPWQVGDWYSTEGEQDWRTGETKTRNFFLDGFSPEEERAVYRGVFPKKAASDEVMLQRWQVQVQDQERQQQQQHQRRHRKLAAARPHGRCEYADHCLEHASNSSIPSCKTG